MTRRVILTVFALSCTVLLTAPFVLHAAEEVRLQEVRPTLEFSPLNLQFSNLQVRRTVGGKSVVDIPWIGEYIAAIYRWAVPVGAIIATVVIMGAGVVWMTSAGGGMKSQAMQWIGNATIGLVLLVGSYVILFTINPELARLRALQVQIVEPIKFTAEEVEDHADNAGSSGGAAPRALCRTIEECRTLCSSSPTSWPTQVPGMLASSSARPIPTIPGLRGGGQVASQEVVEGLMRAAQIADAQGLTIVVASGYRPLRRQIELVCQRMGNAEQERGIGHAVSWPGGSNHGAGNAVDLQLWRGSTVLVRSGGCADQAAGRHATSTNSRLFDQIMTTAGARRYNNEVWHYEFGGSSSCRCTYPNCPSPPMACSGNC